MSSYYAAYSAFGLLLDEEETELFVKNYIEKNKTQLLEWNPNQDIEELVEEWLSCNETIYNYEENEEKPLDIITLRREYCDGIIFYPAEYCTSMAPFRPQKKYGDIYTLIMADMQPSSIQQLAKMPFYETLDEVIAEFRIKCKGILPEDFDYSSHIGEVFYAVYA